MSRRNNGGDWVNTGQAAMWLRQPRELVRTFCLHLRTEGKLPDAWDYDKSKTPVTALDRQWIYDHWAEWSGAWTRWRARRGK